MKIEIKTMKIPKYEEILKDIAKEQIKITGKFMENLEIRKQLAKTKNPEFEKTGTKRLGLGLCPHYSCVFYCNNLEIHDDDDFLIFWKVSTVNHLGRNLVDHLSSRLQK